MKNLASGPLIEYPTYIVVVLYDTMQIYIVFRGGRRIGPLELSRRPQDSRRRLLGI